MAKSHFYGGKVRYCDFFSQYLFYLNTYIKNIPENIFRKIIKNIFFPLRNTWKIYAENRQVSAKIQ